MRSLKGIPFGVMERIRLLLIAGTVLTALTGTVLAAVYSYKCPKCGLIEQYDHIGIFKCPKDGSFMTSVR